MGNPATSILKRLAKWIVKHGQDELAKEFDRRITADAVTREADPTNSQYRE